MTKQKILTYQNAIAINFVFCFSIIDCFVSVVASAVPRLLTTTTTITIIIK